MVHPVPPSTADHHTELLGKPPSSRCCCGKVHVQRGSSLIAGLSLVSVLLNTLLVVMGVDRLGLNPYFEVCVLVVDFLSVMCLLRGLHKRKSGLLRPFLFFNFLWNCGLILLFVWCLIRMAQGTDLTKPFISQLGREDPPSRYPQLFIEFEPQPRIEEGNPFKWLGFVLLFCLGVLIFIGCCFVNVIYKAFRIFAYDEEKEASRLSPPV